MLFNKIKKIGVLAFLTAFWYKDKQFFRISKEICSLSFFHFLSAFLQDYVRERMSLSIQGSDLGFSLKHLKGAIEFNMSAQTVFKEFKWCSASRSASDDSTDREELTLLQSSVKSSQKCGEYTRVCLVSEAVTPGISGRHIINTMGKWLDMRDSITSTSVIDRPNVNIKSKVCPRRCVGRLTHCSKLKESMMFRNSVDNCLEGQHTWTLKSRLKETGHV